MREPLACPPKWLYLSVKRGIMVAENRVSQQSLRASTAPMGQRVLFMSGYGDSETQIKSGDFGVCTKKMENIGEYRLFGLLENG
jgi:hypothetical protein